MPRNSTAKTPRSPARDVVVRCSGQGHRVRLAGGRRFLARARCPVCRATVDPSRMRRLAALVGTLRRPASAERLDRLLWISAFAVLGGSLAGAGLLWGLGDRWWGATVLLFGPRWVLALPVAAVAALGAARDRALLLPVGLAALVIAGPVMGLRTGWRGLLVREDPARDLTIATFNVRGGDGVYVSPSALMLQWGADVAAFQECRGVFAEALRTMPGWHTDVQGSLCLVSRFEILEAASMDRAVIEDAGGSGLVRSYRLAGDDRPFTLTNVHLDTPRAGLALIRSGRVADGIPLLEQKSLLRFAELTRARRFAEEREGPHVAVGDFNTPEESRAYRQAWGAWTNAFGVAGTGLGGTRLNGWIRARIDHVVVDASWRVVDARMGEDAGSDHLPMIGVIRQQRR